jgi:hypothetical protein
MNTQAFAPCSGGPLPPPIYKTPYITGAMLNFDSTGRLAPSGDV